MRQHKGSFKPGTAKRRPATLNKNTMKKQLLLLCAAVALFTGCANLSDASNGAMLGGGLGALAGQAIGHNTKSTLLGAGIGTALGYGVGNERDKTRMQNEIDYLKARR